MIGSSFQVWLYTRRAISVLGICRPSLNGRAAEAMPAQTMHSLRQLHSCAIGGGWRLAVNVCQQSASWPNLGRLFMRYPGNMHGADELTQDHHAFDPSDPHELLLWLGRRG